MRTIREVQLVEAKVTATPNPQHPKYSKLNIGKHTELMLTADEIYDFIELLTAAREDLSLGSS